MTDPAATPADLPKPRVTARDREFRRLQILARLQEGWSYEAIAWEAGLSRERVRQIIEETIESREVNTSRDHVRLQIMRLDPALRLAAEKVAKGDLRAVDRLLRVLDRLDKYQTTAAAVLRVDDGEDLKVKLLAKFERVAEAHRQAQEAKRALEEAQAEETHPEPDSGKNAHFAFFER
jgi:hypothetical protein